MPGIYNYVIGNIHIKNKYAKIFLFLPCVALTKSKLQLKPLNLSQQHIFQLCEWVPLNDPFFSRPQTGAKFDS